MTYKTATVYCCTIFSILIIIISLATNYWYEFEKKANDVKPGTVSHFRVGLFEQCETIYYNHDTEVHDDSEEKDCEDFQVPDGVDDWFPRRDTLIATYIIAMILTLIGFIFVTAYCVTGKYFFPVGRVAICYFLSALVIIIGLCVYTSTFYDLDVSFSWSYGAGWSAAAMYIIAIVLLYADK